MPPARNSLVVESFDMLIAVWIPGYELDFVHFCYRQVCCPVSEKEEAKVSAGYCTSLIIRRDWKVLMSHR